MAKIFGSFKSGARATFDPVGRALVRMGLSPNTVTILGTIGVVAGALIFATRGKLIAGTVVITLAALFDVVDGAMARARGRPSRYGAVLDSAMDRVADGVVFGSVAWWLATTGQRVVAAVCLVCLVGGQVVSYVKARAESLGFSCDVGVAERLERLIILGIGGLLGGFGVSWGLGAALWVLAVLSVATATQRLLHVRRQELAGAGSGSFSADVARAPERERQT
jgi:CDP-diacylglycerol--glycerol-3-phosphate 3-phosphatidyltransferase